MYTQEFFEVCRKQTIDTFQGKVDQKGLDELLAKMPQGEDQLSAANDVDNTPGAIEAEASIVSAVFWSKVKCEPKAMPWQFSESAWGPGIGGGSCIGFMYTAYDSWDAFFENTTAYHAQGIASAGGVFQINWFNSAGTPIGQFNGAMGGAGAFEVGGSGSWSRK